MKSEADVLNAIEKKVYEDKKVTQAEINLLLESYVIYKIRIPQEIENKLGLK